MADGSNNGNDGAKPPADASSKPLLQEPSSTQPTTRTSEPPVNEPLADVEMTSSAAEPVEKAAEAGLADDPMSGPAVPEGAGAGDMLAGGA